MDLGPAGTLALITLDNGFDHTKPNTFGPKSLLSLNAALDSIAPRAAAGEITANTLRHTSAGGTFWVWHTGEEIICQVQDQGWISDPLAGRKRRSPESSGHGLWVVNQMCDLVEIRTSQAAGTIIRLHMRREGA